MYVLCIGVYLYDFPQTIFPFGCYYSILPQEQSKCFNKVLEEHQQLVEVINPDASSIPIPESQPAIPPVSPLVLPCSLVSPRIEADYAEQLDNIHIFRTRINPDSHQIYSKVVLYQFY